MLWNLIFNLGVLKGIKKHLNRKCIIIIAYKKSWRFIIKCKISLFMSNVNVAHILVILLNLFKNEKRNERCIKYIYVQKHGQAFSNVSMSLEIYLLSLLHVSFFLNGEYEFEKYVLRR